MAFELVNSLRTSEELIEGLLDIVANTVSNLEEDRKDSYTSRQDAQHARNIDFIKLQGAFQNTQIEKERLKTRLATLQKEGTRPATRVELKELDNNTALTAPTVDSAIKQHSGIIEYAKSKINLFQNISKVKLDGAGSSPDQGDPDYESVNSLWKVIDEFK